MFMVITEKCRDCERTANRYHVESDYSGTPPTASVTFRRVPFCADHGPPPTRYDLGDWNRSASFSSSLRSDDVFMG